MNNQAIKSLLAAVDFSDYSKLVAEEAKLLAKKMKIPLQFIYVVQDISMFSSTYKLNKVGFVRETEKKIRDKYKLNARTKVAIAIGKPHECIIRSARNLKRPLILIGHRSRNPVARLFIGSTAEKVALYSPFPVWVHRGEKARIPKRILVPFDFSPRTDRSVETVQALSKPLNSKIEMYHVMEQPIAPYELDSFADHYVEIKRADDAGLAAFRAQHPKLKVNHSQGWVVDSIQVRSKRFDLIAVAPRNSKTLGYFGSVTTKLIRTGNKPLLILP